MKMVKSVLLSSAATFALAGAAAAADLPVMKAPAKVFVEVCTDFEGFYRIPGTDTCVRVGGYVRFDWGYGGSTTASQNFAWARPSSLQGSLSRFVLVMDARPMTDYGRARIYANIIVANVTGNQGGGFNGGTTYAFGQGAVGNPNTFSTVQNAFVSLAGFTFGYLSSNFDYLFFRYLMHTMTTGSNRWINQASYTYKFSNEWSGIIAVEDPGNRKFPILQVGAQNIGGILVPTLVNGATAQVSNVPPFVYAFGNAGKSIMPEIVGRLNYRAAWGDFGIMGALHEVRPAFAAFPGAGATTILLATPAGGFPAALPGGLYIAPDTKIGGAVQAGITLKTPGGGNPKIADEIAFQAAYSIGAIDYVLNGSGPAGNSFFGGFAAAKGSNFTIANGVFQALLGDAVYNPATGALDLTEAWTVQGVYRHFWNPFWRTVVSAGYTKVNFKGPAVLNVTPLPVLGFNSPLVGADVSIFDSIIETTYSPYTDLDLGVGVGYTRIDPQGPKSVDGWAGFFRAQWNY